MIEEEKIEAVVPAQEQESVVATVEPEQDQPMGEEVDVLIDEGTDQEAMEQEEDDGLSICSALFSNKLAIQTA